MPRGELFILSAPSGAGKTTLIKSIMGGGLAEFGDVAFSVSHTTRTPREGERDGADYHFVDHETFQGMISGEEFLEWAEVHNNYYGTSLAEVNPRLEAGIDVIMDIDVQGAERVLGNHPEANSIFIMPPSFGDLKRRLHQRGLDQAQEISRRLAVSIWEIKRYHRYDHVIINDDAGRAADALAAIILAKRHRRDRMAESIGRVLEDFETAVASGEDKISPAADGTDPVVEATLPGSS